MNTISYNVKVKKILFVFLNLCLSVLIIIASIENVGSDDKYWVEVEDAIEISPEIKIINDDRCSGGKGIESTSQSHTMKAYASYNISLEKSGIYYIWARSLWVHGCGNTFAMGFDNVRPFIFGNDNDNIFHFWHWVKCTSIQLNKGKHDFYIWNEEQGAKLDKVLLTMDPYFLPVGKGENTECYSTFEGGIPSFISSNNKSLWKIEKINKNYSYYLKYHHLNQVEYSFLNANILNSSFFKCNFKIGNNNKSNNICIAFNYFNNKNYNKISLFNNLLEIRSIVNGHERKIKNFKLKNKVIYPAYSNSISIIFEKSNLYININGKPIVKLNNYVVEGGKIGIGSNIGDVYFNEIEFRNDLTPIGFREWQWNYIKGIWLIDEDHSTIQKLKAYNDSSALILTGKEYWKNYSVTAAVSTNDNAGICFYVQDSINYYKYEINQNQKNITLLSLLKVENDKQTVLQKKEFNLIKGEWYKLNVNKKNNLITAFIDDYMVMDYIDSTFDYGAIGICSNSKTEYAFFDDIKVDPISSNNTTDNDTCRYLYEFLHLENGAYDLCDWINSKKNFIRRGDRLSYIKKELFMESIIINKRTFSGNFKFQAHHSVPQDMEYNVYVWTNNSIEYKVSFKKDKILIFKEKKLVLEKNYIKPKNNFIIEYQDNTWKISAGNYKVIEYIDGSNLHSYQFGISFSGIGSGIINDSQISILSEQCDNKILNTYYLK